MVFHWSLSDSKSPQISWTLLSILAVLSNAVVWMVSTRPPNSKSSSPFSNPLVTVLNTAITIGIIVTYMFHSFFQFSSKVEVLILLFTFFQFYSVVSRGSKVNNFASSFYNNNNDNNNNIIIIIFIIIIVVVVVIPSPTISIVILIPLILSYYCYRYIYIYIYTVEAEKTISMHDLRVRTSFRLNKLTLALFYNATRLCWFSVTS